MDIRSPINLRDRSSGKGESKAVPVFEQGVEWAP